MPKDWKEAISYALVYGITYVVVYSVLAPPLQKLIWGKNENAPPATPPQNQNQLSPEVYYEKMQHY